MKTIRTFSHANCQDAHIPCWLAASLLLLLATCASAASLLLEAEAFTSHGGWSLDTQFTETAGSPFLLAHGLGSPVADASTTVILPGEGDSPAKWRIWIRTRNWTPGFTGTDAPGRFQLFINQTPLPVIFGDADSAWNWQDGGVVDLPAGEITLALRDLTGFDGRCDALFFTTETTAPPPPDSGAELTQWRAGIRGETMPPSSSATFDLVVVGGGLGGCCAALAAARSELRVALVQDRPVLGGNASQEIRVASRGGRRYKIVAEIDTLALSNRDSDTIACDSARLATIQAEPNITLLMPWSAYAAGTNSAGRITHVDIRHTANGQRQRLNAPLFVDATGDGWIGYWAGADWRMGREARTTHNELLAPMEADSQTLGSSLMWTSRLDPEPTEFPTNLPWATAIAGTAAETGGNWDWEYGINAALDTIQDAEHIRDHLLRAIYGNFANAKLKPENANRTLDWVPFIAGKRESRRLLGHYILTQSDVLEGRWFEDAVVTTDWGIDLHKETAISYRASATNHGKVSPCYIPYRCLFSRNIRNLFMTGRNISVTHVGLGSPRVMNTIGQMGVVAGYAASLCKKHACDPADIYRYADKFESLRELLDANAISAIEWPSNPYTTPFVSVVDNLDAARVRIYGEWTSSSSDSLRWGANYLHDGNTGKGDKFVLFKPDIPPLGVCTIATFHSNGGKRATNAPVWIITDDLRTTAPAPLVHGRSTSPDLHADGSELLLGRRAPNIFFRGYLRFDLTGLPTDVLLDDAVITLTVGSVDSVSENETIGAAGMVVQELTEPFDPNAVTWNSRATGTPWTEQGGTFEAGAVTAITAPPLPLSVTNGMPISFPSTTNLMALVKNLQTNSAPEKLLHLVVRTPDLEKSYAGSKLYRFAGARLDVTYIDPSAPPTMRINLKEQQAQWRPLGVFTNCATGLRVMLGNGGTDDYVTADAVRAQTERPDIDPEDYDGNGLPNAWERLHFMQETGTDPLADPDGDGRSNINEFEHGTDPLNPLSFFNAATRMLLK